MSKKRQAETAASLGDALASLGTPAQAVAAIERMLDPAPITIAEVAAYTNQPTLPGLAKQINAAFGEVDRTSLLATDARINAGNLLKTARERMPERGTFADWCKVNIKRGKSDIYRCLALVKSTDPEEQAEARETEKAAAREGMTAKREREAKPIVPNVGDRALAAITAAKPAPSNAVWNEPASQTRDKDISVTATALGALTGYPLAKAIEEKIRLLGGYKWSSIPDARRAMLADLVHKLANEIAPVNSGETK